MDNKRVILIKGDKTKWYEEAIFIVKPGAPQIQSFDYVSEAEAILSRYVETGQKPLESKAKSGKKILKNFRLNAVMFACCLILAGILSIAFFR